MRTWAALRASSVESRFEALHVTGLTAEVGRKKNSNCCCDVGREQRSAKVRWSSSPARPVSANRDLLLRFWKLSKRAAHAPALFLFSAAHRQRALSDHQPDGTCCRICAQRHPPSDARQTRCRPGAEFSRHRKTQRCLPKCCRCRTMDDTQHSKWLRGNGGRRRWKHSLRKPEGTEPARSPC